MKLFIDTANVDHIREIAAWGVLDGATTNPSLIAKEGRDFREVIEEICSIVDGPISAEARRASRPMSHSSSRPPRPS
jgi:transaldolase